MNDYQKYINALKKCAKEHENDRTSTGHIIVSELCKDTTNLLEALEQKEERIHCKDCKYRDYWGDCLKWSKELDAHKTYLLDENMFCGFAEIKDGK